MAISKEVASKLAALLANTAHLEEKIRYIKPEELSSERLLDEMWDIKVLVEKIVDELEFQDENMDPEKTKLDLTSVNELFSEHPVTDFVSARFDYAKGDQSPEVTSKMLAAAKKLREEQALPSKAELYDRVRSYDEITTNELTLLMDDIEKVLKDGDKDSYTEQDIEMIRFFFSNLPMNRKIDIDAASDADIESMWAKHKLVKDIWAF